MILDISSRALELLCVLGERGGPAATRAAGPSMQGLVAVTKEGNWEEKSGGRCPIWSWRVVHEEQYLVQEATHACERTLFLEELNGCGVCCM